MLPLSKNIVNKCIIRKEVGNGGSIVMGTHHNTTTIRGGREGGREGGMGGMGGGNVLMEREQKPFSRAVGCSLEKLQKKKPPHFFPQKDKKVRY